MSNRTVEQLTFGAHLNSWKLPKMWWSRNIAKGAPEPKTGVKTRWSGAICSKAHKIVDFPVPFFPIPNIFSRLSGNASRYNYLA